MKRLAVFFAIFTVGALLPALPAAATSGTGSSQSGSGQCTSGSSCRALLNRFISYSGSTSGPGTGGNGNPVDVTPPPCLWNQIGDATTGSNAIIGEWGKDPSKAPTTFQIDQSVKKADALLKNPQQGEWYELPVNPNASQAAQQECLTLPLYYWVQAGAAPPLKVQPVTLAQMAFSVVTTPTVTGIETNPTGNSETNLPTFVKATLQAAAGQLLVAPDGHVYTWVTASLNGVSATVWIKSTGPTLDITSGSPNATVYSGCNHAQSAGKGVTLGSGASDAQMAQTNANQAIDCGVTYRGPGTFTMQVSIDWTACWAPIGNTNGAPPPAGCQAVPGAGNLNPATFGKNVNVQDIQSVNG